MNEIRSFEPLIGRGPKVLILGSMPGVASLDVRQYYAHPRNVFWPIMSALFDIDWTEHYGMRVEQFRRLPLALWDVLQTCARRGSLDAAIERDSIRLNDIAGLLDEHPGIRLIAFNGRTAEQLFRRHQLKALTQERPDTIVLPSTSPAHAAKTFEQKLDEWRRILAYLN